MLGNCVIVVYLVLAAPVLAAVLFWGSWGWLVAAAAVVVIEYATLRRSQRFSARLWRSVRVGHRSRHERAAESIYAVSAVVGVVLLVVAVLAALWSLTWKQLHGLGCRHLLSDDDGGAGALDEGWLDWFPLVGAFLDEIGAPEVELGQGDREFLEALVLQLDVYPSEHPSA